MEAIRGNACPQGRAEPSPKGRREAARRGPPLRTGVVKDRLSGLRRSLEDVPPQEFGERLPRCAPVEAP